MSETYYVEIVRYGLKWSVILYDDPLYTYTSFIPEELKFLD